MARPVLRPGDRGPAVLELVQLLNNRGASIVPTDTYTRREVYPAVLDFQSHATDASGHPLVDDGIVGPLTWWALLHPHIQLPRPALGGLVELPQVGGSRLGRMALQVAMEHYGVGEEGGNNRGAWVRGFLGGHAEEGSAWCAGFVSHCLHTAAVRLEVDPPLRYSVGARALRNACKRRGWAYTAEDRRPQPGDLAFWWRGRPNSWQGHVGIVHHSRDGLLWVVEGNRGPFPSTVRPYRYVLGRIERSLGFAQIP